MILTVKWRERVTYMVTSLDTDDSVIDTREMRESLG